MLFKLCSIHNCLSNWLGPPGGRRGTVEPSGVYTRNNDAPHQECTFLSRGCLFLMHLVFTRDI